MKDFELLKDKDLKTNLKMLIEERNRLLRKIKDLDIGIGVLTKPVMREKEVKKK